MIAARNRGRPAGEDGHVALELALGVGVLLLPVALLVLTLPTWVERQSMARVAAQEAARAVVLAGTDDEGVAAGTALARQTATNHGLAADEVSVALSGSLERGAAVTATVSVGAPVVVLPVIGEVGGWTWSVSHTERVDDYRSVP